MRVIVNQIEYELPDGSLVSNAVASIEAKPPYAVAVNLTFVPKAQYTNHVLQENDQIEIIAPVTGG